MATLFNWAALAGCKNLEMRAGQGSSQAVGHPRTHKSSLIFLRATSCPVSLFLALYTTP